jgi:DNA-binding transcriptional ArsR family regulator
MTLSEADVDRLFHALADRTRRDIIGRAITHDQKHVAVLERAALVTKEHRGREQIVHANGPTIAKAIALLDQYEQLWVDRANQIAAILETPEESEGDHK